jgi:hypothetical protein
MRHYLAKCKNYENTSDIGWNTSEGIVFFPSFNWMLKMFYNGDYNNWTAADVRHNVFIPAELT